MRRFATLGFLTLALLALAACGGGDGGGGGGGGEAKKEGVEPRTWTKKVCEAGLAWQKDIKDSGTALQSDIQKAKNLRGVRRELADFFQNAADRTDVFIADVRGLGAPAVDDGAAVSRELQRGFGEMRDVFSDSAAQTRKVPVNDPNAFSTEVQQLSEVAERRLDEAGKTFNQIDAKYDVPELDRAFDDDPACQRFARGG